MRTSKEVIGLARRSGAKRIEIRFVDAVGVSRQFTCPVGQPAENPGEEFDGSAEALTSSFRAVTPGLNPRFDGLLVSRQGFNPGTDPLHGHGGSTLEFFTDDASPEIFRSGSLTVDLGRHLVSVGGKAVRLSITEFSLLRLLIRNVGNIVSHAEMLREVWGEELSGKLNYLRVYFVALRKKLETPGEPPLFLTERSLGYRLVIR